MIVLRLQTGAHARHPPSLQKGAQSCVCTCLCFDTAPDETQYTQEALTSALFVVSSCVCVCVCVCVPCPITFQKGA